MNMNNDTRVARKRSGGSGGGSHSSVGGAISVPEFECIVNPNKSAIVVRGGNATEENPAISLNLASLVAKKSFAFSVSFSCTSDLTPSTRYGQGGLIQCPSVATLDGSPRCPSKRKQKLLDTYGPTSAPPTIKHSSTASRICAIPVTVLHNVLQDWCRGQHYTVLSHLMMENATKPGGEDLMAHYYEYNGRNESYSSGSALTINFPAAEGEVARTVEWKYGWDITCASMLRKNAMPQTDPNLSFEAVGADFEYKVGQKVGMAVYRNYEFDFTNDDVLYTDYQWNKNKLTRDDILRLFGQDFSVSIYTGEITAVSTDKKTFRHDINTFKGCSGAIVFLLDKHQNGLVEDTLHGKAIGVHAGAYDEATTTESESSEVKRNLAFALAGFAEEEASKVLEASS